jgi:outer membrane receptor protein involved in Fe transport
MEKAYVNRWHYLIGVLGGFVFVLLGFGQANMGKIKGKVVDKDTGEPVQFATIQLIQNGIVKGGGFTNDKGEFSIAPVPPGTYDIKVMWSGKEKVVQGVIVTANETVVLDIQMQTVTTIETVEIEAYKVPLFKKDETVVQRTVTAEEVQQIATRNAVDVAALTAGVVQTNEGANLNIRGQRTGGTQYYIDGIRVIGSLALPQKAIDQLQVITGGTPAEFGDATGGIVNVTTTAPSSQHGIGVELVSSQFTDPYNHNLASISLTGPIWNIKDPNGVVLGTRLGYFAAVELQSELDDDPPAFPLKKVKDNLREDIRKTPLVPNRDGSFFYNRALFLKPEDLEETKYKLNNDSRGLRGLARLDYAFNDKTFLKIGLNGTYFEDDIWSFSNSLLVPEANERRKTYTGRGYIRFQQSFPGDTNSKIRNIFYTLQADFTRTGFTRGDARFGDRIFEYGYVGRFIGKQAEIFDLIFPSDPRHQPTISNGPYWQTVGFADTAYYFDPSTAVNPDIANYNRVIYDFIARNGNPAPIFNPVTGEREYREVVYNQSQLLALGGVLNGFNTWFLAPSTNIYSLFLGTGTSFTFYAKGITDQYRFFGQGVAEIGAHNLKIGMEFEQRVERFYGISAYFLWQLMRQYANSHIVQLDQNNPQPVYLNGYFQDTVRLPRLYDANTQSHFDKKLREKLGLPINATDYINTDAYTPDFYSLDMFSANELFNAGNPIVFYYGYTYTGRLDPTTSYQTFFQDLEKRPQPAFRPTYIAGYIEDKFELENIFLTLGLRVDRWDGNRIVLKDKYLLVPVYNAKEASQILGLPLPEGVGDDWVPYVDNKNNPTRFVGFRKGDQWYDANGNPVSSDLIAQAGGGKVQPFVKVDSITYDAFTDYKPQINWMPRVSFSFPISDEATFFAHYDVLTQRPRSFNAPFLTDLIFLPSNPTNVVDNPALQPERTIDFEVGFKQKIGSRVAFSASAFYREMRNMIQSFRVLNAYPVTYDTYENIDFGTAKGFTFELDVRRSGLLRGRIAYTLQYATGTGSSANSSRNALRYLTGFSIIRIPLPLTFDQRHTLTANLDLRFQDKKLRGPAITIGQKTVYPLKNFGINFTANVGSGLPYSRSSIPDPAAVQFGVNSAFTLQGEPLGNRLPMNYRFDIRAEKDFYLRLGGKKDENGQIQGGRDARFQIYLLVLNVLNRQNIIGVYQFTGLPDDSGYLSTAIGSQLANSQVDPEAFRMLYKIRERNPNNYSLPRRVRLGLQFFF